MPGPLIILDIPPVMHAAAVGFPDPETPVGARGVGEPPVGAADGAVMNAIASAVGVDAFRRAPVTPDVLLMTLEHGRRVHEPLQAHCSGGQDSWRARQPALHAGRRS